jgi:hypothetical protein
MLSSVVRLPPSDIRSHAGTVGVEYPREHEGRCEAWPSAPTCFSPNSGTGCLQILSKHPGRSGSVGGRARRFCKGTISTASGPSSAATASTNQQHSHGGFGELATLLLPDRSGHVGDQDVSAQIVQPSDALGANRSASSAHPASVRQETPRLSLAHGSRRRPRRPHRCRVGTPPAAAWSRARLLVRRRRSHARATAAAGSVRREAEAGGQVSRRLARRRAAPTVRAGQTLAPALISQSER